MLTESLGNGLSGGLGSQIPRLENRPPSKFTSGDEIADLSAAYGLTLDPWQRHVLTGAMGETESGLWATPRVALSVPRQNGKNAILEARELAGLILFGEELIIHSAHEVKTALEAYIRIRSFFENYDDLRRRVRRVVAARGAEEIVLLSGQRLRFMARSKGAGRGFSADCLVLDEAQHLADTTYAAILPTLSARANPQIWLTGTPPGPEQDGEVFARERKNGLEGSERIYYAEWSAEPKIAPDSVEGWKQANPAYGIRIQHATIADEREGLSEHGFCMERLGQWDVATTPQIIPADTWRALGVEDAVPEDAVKRVAFGVDMDPERNWTSISAAFPMVDPLTQQIITHVEVIQHREGSGWVKPYLKSLTERRTPHALVIDSAGPASSLIEPLRLDGVLVTATGASQMKQACGQFYDAAMGGYLRHSAQPQLATALGVARKRDLGDAWAWHRRDSKDDITPLVSATLALWGLHAEGVAKPKAERKQKTISTKFYTFS